MTTTTKNIINSFIIVPLVATTLSMNVFTTSINKAIAGTIGSDVALAAEQSLDAERALKAAKIDAYFAKSGLPLAGHGMAMVVAAEKHNLPWNLIPAIAMRESTGCKFIIPGTNNCFGWGGGKVKFATLDSAIESMATHLSGDDPQTARYYDGKDVRGILQTYNPPSVVATYADQVMSIMRSIDNSTV